MHTFKNNRVFQLFSELSLESPQRQKIDGELSYKSAEASIILRYFDPELGIDGDMATSAKFVSDEESFWYKVHFHGTRCVEKVMSLDKGIYTHTWYCDGNGCTDSCDGIICRFADITVLRENGKVGSSMLPINCGDAVKVSISKDNAKALGYHFFEIAELAVVGRDCQNLGKHQKYKLFCKPAVRPQNGQKYST